MFLALGLLLPLSAHGASYGMTLTGLQYPAPSSGGEAASVTTVPLRGPPGQHGNVWGLTDPGTNILPCGSLGNADFNQYERIDVEKGKDFNLMGRIWSTQNGEGTLILSIKYGQRPDFRDDPGMILLEYSPALTETPLNWVTTTSIPEPAFTDNATIQVAYTTGQRPANWTEDLFDDARDRPWSTVYQCIDLSVTGARPRPAGVGDSYDPLDYVPTPSSGPGGAPTAVSDSKDGKMPVLNIVLIAIAVFLAILAILVCVCCLLRKKKRPVEPAPKPTGFTEPGETAAPVPPPPPPGDGNTVHFKIHDADPPSPPQVETPAEPEVEREGSHGRLFHFKYTYLDGDEENVEEDRAVQRRTLERRALEGEFDDHKHT